ncbi:MAG: putative anaerobic ribonucleoside-triphosphate reductase activating protein [Bacillales bacterium]|nr:putative anaerobic ribonucleoside-triphosphate reductase activating protein [Bacillales bacterium]
MLNTAKKSARVMNIIHDSIVDGPGLRTVIFFAGCEHRCKGCHNPESWNYQNGSEMTVEQILAEIKANPITNVTFSGGDPFFQADVVIDLAKLVKDLGKNLWVYTGYTLEQIQVNNRYDELLKYVDVLVDGPFIESEKDYSIDFRGSRNQKIHYLSPR